MPKAVAVASQRQQCRKELEPEKCFFHQALAWSRSGTLELVRYTHATLIASHLGAEAQFPLLERERLGRGQRC